MLHSLRQLEKSRTIDRLLWLVAAGICAWILAVSVANAQQLRPRFPVTSAQIVSAMQNREMSTRNVQVRLPGPITSSVADPALEIQSVSQINSHEMRLRIACLERADCLPFFVVVTSTDELASSSLPVKSAPPTVGTEHPSSLVKNSAEAISAQSVSSKSATSGEPPILRSGAPATLGFDGDHLHVRVEVICLQSGAAGDKIRVTTPDHKQIYVAEIVAPTLLKGTLPK